MKISSGTIRILLFNQLACLVLGGLFLIPTAKGQDFDPPEQTIGERLFLETRFAQFFFAHSDGNANAVLVAGDLVMSTTVTTNGPVPGPFLGQSMNCRACHIVDEMHDTLGNRTYCDFARRSPIPARNDGRTVTPRNSPPLVNSLLTRQPMFLHFDGEFTTAKDLIKGTLTGRNYGWLPNEHDQSVKHIAHIVRDDDGSGDLAAGTGSFALLLKGTDPSIPDELRLPKKYRINVAHANDREILDAVAALIQAYMEGLVFAQDENGEFSTSPYDVFLQKNGLPRKPAKHETPTAYGQRLLTLIQNLSSPQFVTDADGQFTTHTDEAFQFGPTQLAGLKIFLTPSNASPVALQTGGVGNCVACHLPPTFTDFKFHNTGATQEEYDSLHGQGAFALLSIPSLKERRKNPDAYLPPSEKHPNATGRFRAPPTADDASQTDLGLWNIFANPDMPKSQSKLHHLMTHGSDAELLPQTIAQFKTPGLRDLSHSAPYLHTGGKDSFEDVIEFYRQFSALTRADSNRNGDIQLQGISLTEDDVAPLAAFLRSLDEDYE